MKKMFTQFVRFLSIDQNIYIKYKNTLKRIICLESF